MEIPIPTLHLFPKLDEQLISLLKSLKADDWHKPTLAKKWTVKNVASHLLDGNIRTMSIARDKFIGDPPGKINSYRDLVDYLNRLNADWVQATKRLSPRVLVDLMESTGHQYYECLKGLDPFGPAVFPVDWAGERESKNWFHIAREYTEKWHHQAQIRSAVGQPGIMTREFFFPVIDTFMQALPHTFREVQAKENASVQVHITGEAGGYWLLLRLNNSWTLSKAKHDSPTAQVSIDPDVAWRLFTKGIDRLKAEQRIQFAGDINLATPILTMVSVMA